MTRQLDFSRTILYQCLALLALNRAEVAQLVEHSPEKAGVDSSILSLGTTQAIRNITYFNQAAGRNKQPSPSISPSMERALPRWVQGRLEGEA